MRKFRLVAVCLILVVVSAISIFAQTPQQNKPVSKIGLINTYAFGDGKTGITKYSAAMSSVDAAFKKELDELNVMVTRVQSLEKELTDMLNKLTTPAPGQTNDVPLRVAYNAKLEEYDKLGREYKFKQNDLRTRYQRRRQEVMGPILIDIGKAMREFGRQRGYTMLLDGAKLSDGGLLLAWDEKADLTKDFITFYNALPATATITKPVK